MTKILGFLILVFCGTGLANPTRTLKLRFTDAPPIYYLDKDSKPTGTDIRYVQELLQKAGFDFELVRMPWARGLLALETGKVDLMMSLGRSPERENKFRWIGPYRTERFHIYVKGEDRKLKIDTVAKLISILDERKQKIGILRGNIVKNKELNKYYSDDKLRKKYFHEITDNDQLPKLLQHNRVFGYTTIKIIADYINSITQEYRNFASLPLVVSEAPVYLGVSKHIPEADFQRLLTAAKQVRSVN